MRTRRFMTAALLAGAALLGTAGTAVADSPSPSPSSSGSGAGPTEAGTSFRTATPVQPGQRATAGASTGDYLYWVVPVDTGQRATMKAKVTLPKAARHGASTWQIDVYDGLRRRQACAYGAQTRAAAADAASVEVSCTLRTVRSWAEQSSNDPLPGSYYVRLTVTGLPQDDLGLPVKAEFEPSVDEAGGAYAVDGKLSKPLVPGVATADPEDGPSASPAPAAGKRSAGALEPEGGWSSGRWSDRWVWTAVGALLAALAGIFGYSVTRGSGRPSRVPPGV
ncbi:hypothetical protein ADK70_21020 [Streptomyces rimosus subsp. pseudoverticillatus]|uniref:hypothetical protein n=1 Tax=Streptomyces rimosus TaxID=1927 RepID=UPI0006B2611C|nr:hypothetical protein [Streptomyces rimosus]KOT85983.1 hypothetical protein ADK70_21020 [Streptomyces rimosus subsp. pseudoverticillatus]